LTPKSSTPSVGGGGFPLMALTPGSWGVGWTGVGCCGTGTGAGAG
jgi:hypothetical protein